jgi:type I restriction enzyme, S subunit
MVKLSQVKVFPLNRTTLGVQASFQKGYAFKSGSYTDVGQPIVKVSDFTDASVDPEGLVCISPEVAQNYTRYRLQTNDVVIQTVGSWPSNPASVVGKVIRIPHAVSGALLNQNAVKLSPSSSLDQQFLFYRLRCQDFKDYIVGTAQGAASQASITLESIRAFEFDLFDIAVQKQIASVLSAYDDVIENNTRRIKILEEMAQRIYREWFVDFRFPGHEKVNLTKSGLVSIPEGWEIRHLGEITAAVTKGTTPTTLGRDFQPTGINFVKVESISESGVISLEKVAKIDHETHELLKRSQLKENDILFSIAGAIGRTALVTERLLPANTNQALAIIRCADPYLVPYVFWTIRASAFQHFSLGRVVQTAQANVSLSILKSIPIIVPAMYIVEQFNQTLVPILNLVDVLIRKNDILRKVRGFLLPKLISGEVSVEYHEAEAASQVS